MKNLTLLAIAFFITLSSIAQNEETKTLNVEGVDREYLVITPEGYDNKKDYPLIVALHGYYQYVSTFRLMTKMDSIANAEEYILVYPTGGIVEVQNNPLPGCLKPEGLGWETEGYFIPKYGQDDHLFLSKLMDQLEKDYAVDSEREYLYGVSNGGFLATSYAVKNPSRFTAVSIWKSMDSLTPSAGIPMLVSLGENDPIGNLRGHEIGYEDWSETLASWIQANGVNTTPQTSMLPDLSTDDSSTVRLDKYSGGAGTKDLWVYTEVNGNHMMPGLPKHPNCPQLGIGSLDYESAAVSIAFFKNQVKSPGVGMPEVENQVKVYPNPANASVTFELRGRNQELTVDLIDIQGKSILNFHIPSATSAYTLNLSDIPSGLYFYRIQSDKGISQKPIVIRH